ncbi:MAG TPA: fused ferrous iron transport protein A/B [Candidatus Edwardsbacteria bacterium]|nr:fused ferrous iron transport protein A/B [Candidatus Edwardsbacteria bacterium]
MNLDLLQLKNGEEADVTAIEAPPEEQARIERLGVRPGVRLRKVSEPGPVIVAIGTMQVALGAHAASQVKVAARTFRALLFGNPNVGKSVVFSRLTGLEVISANYAGTTVEYTRGHLFAGDQRVELTDVPGAYTLEATCTAEQIARDLCSRRDADLLVNVVDATNLERNLYLTLQLLEQGIPMVVALNKWDLAQRRGIGIDVAELSRRLGVPVVPVVAVSGQGLKQLVTMIGEAIQGQIPAPSFAAIDHQERWHIIGHISQEVQTIVHRHPTLLERLEEASVRPLSGTLIALLVLAGSFAVVRLIGEGLITYALDPFFQKLYGPFVFWATGFVRIGWLRAVLLGTTPEFMTSFGALTTGVYIPLAVVLPYIVSFYLVLGFLEDAGYLPRLAVLLDRVMHRLGLHGYAAMPLVLSCGCKVPGVLGLRILESKREKFIALALLLLAAPCLPQSAMMVSLLSPYGAGYVLLTFAVLAAVAVANSVLLNRMIKGASPEIVMEIPPYQVPHAGTMLRKLWFRIRTFLLDAAPMIVLGILIVNVLDLLGAVRLLGTLARPLVVNVLGLPERAVSVVVLGFLRKDISIALLLPLNLSAKQAVTASLFLVMYLPCVATFAVAAREAGWRSMAKLIAVTLGWAGAVGWAVNMLWR